MQKKQLLSRLDSALIRRVKVDAAERDITVSSIIEEALNQYYDRRDSQGRRPKNQVAV